MCFPIMGSGLSFSDALFEAVSGGTTTGLSTLTKVEGLSKTFLFGRAWMQWHGGLGIVLLSLALLFRPERIEDLSDRLDCSFLNGDGSTPAILREVGPEQTDVLFCLTDSDQANLISGLVGRSLGFRRVILSIQDSEFEGICRELGLVEDTILPSRTISRYLLGKSIEDVREVFGDVGGDDLPDPSTENKPYAEWEAPQDFEKRIGRREALFPACPAKQVWFVPIVHSDSLPPQDLYRWHTIRPRAREYPTRCGGNLAAVLLWNRGVGQIDRLWHVPCCIESAANLTQTLYEGEEHEKPERRLCGEDGSPVGAMEEGDR